MAPADVGLGGLLGSRLFLALFHFDFEQLCPEHVPGHGAIAVLGTIALALTTMFVGICVRRTADSGLFTCWPPAPPDPITMVPPSLVLIANLIGTTTTRLHVNPAN